MRYLFILYVAILGFSCSKSQDKFYMSPIIQEISSGIMKLEYGIPDEFTPYHFLNKTPMIEAINSLPSSNESLIDVDKIKVKLMDRGCIVEIPLDKDEQIYGFGLQMNSFRQNGFRKWPVVNGHPLENKGLTHAPVPMYVSTRGYAVLVNTARYTNFYMGTHTKKSNAIESKENLVEKNIETEKDLYNVLNSSSGYAVIDIPNAKGIELFIFEARDIKSAIQKYNLFSGGGALPPLWGLGIKYRVKRDFTQNSVIEMADYFRNSDIPCDVLGLEPLWHTAHYSCSFVWNREYFPDDEKLIEDLNQRNLKLNLWEHAYVHPTSPLFEPLKKLSGDYLVWKGLVPDFALQEARDIFAEYHDSTFVQKGISGFKLDECDNSRFDDAGINWGFPDMTEFPSGIDGEQMHQLFGVLYQKLINEMYVKRNQRTYLDVRASNAFTSSIPAVLYSDQYKPEQYLRMVVNSGFSGLLWSPEVRHSFSEDELYRRSQLALLSAQALYNSWYLKNPPWLQFDRDKNNNDELLPNGKEVEATIRKLFKQRMRLIPYLYSSFAKYRFEGAPPFRALVMDYPNDKNVFEIYDEFLIGENLLAVPLVPGQDRRTIYLPEGEWYDFNTNEKYNGGREYEYTCSYDQLPLFVKSGSILPLAEPVNYISPDMKFRLKLKAYGDNCTPFKLYEDDGHSYNYENGEYNWITISTSNDNLSIDQTSDYSGKLYEINTKVDFIK